MKHIITIIALIYSGGLFSQNNRVISSGGNDSSIIEVNQTGSGTLFSLGDVVAQDNSTYILANATDDTKTALGVVIEIVDNDNIIFQTEGKAAYTKSTLTKGDNHYLATTDGDVITSQPLDNIQSIFHAISPNEIIIKISPMFVSNAPPCQASQTHNLLCDDNGTPTNTGDDYFDLSITGTITDGSGNYIVTINGYTSPVTVSGQLFTVLGDGTHTNLLADGSSTYLVRVEDELNSSCFVEFTTAAVNHCSTTNLCVATQTHNLICFDNGTPTDTGDDYFDLSITGTITDGSGNYTATVNGYTTPITASGVSVTILGEGTHTTLNADGVATYLVRIEDATDSNCFIEFTTAVVPSCSTPLEMIFSFQSLVSTGTQFGVVERSSDNATDVLLLPASGSVDLTTGMLGGGDLGTWSQSGDVRIKEWYNQGDGGNLVQNTHANQPLLVEAGALKMVNGKAAAYFDTNQWMDNTTISMTQPCAWQTIIYLEDKNDGLNQIPYDGGPSGTGRQIPIWHDDPPDEFKYFSGANQVVTTTPIWDTRIVIFADYDNPNEAIYYDNVDQLVPSSGSNSQVGLTIGARFSNSSTMKGYIQEILGWDSDQAANRNAHYSNLLSRY